MDLFLYVLWLLFAAIFFYLGYVSWQQSQEELRPFAIRERDHEVRLDAGEGGAQSGEAFVAEFNAYLEQINAQNSKRLKASAVAYFIAGVLSVISLLPVFF